MIERLTGDGLISDSSNAIKLEDMPGILKIMEKFRTSFLDTMASAMISLLGP